MWVKMKISASGPRFGCVAGDVLEFSPKTAHRLIERGHAEAFKRADAEPIAPEAAVKTAPETAMKPAAKGRFGRRAPKPAAPATEEKA